METAKAEVEDKQIIIRENKGIFIFRIPYEIPTPNPSKLKTTAKIIIVQSKPFPPQKFELFILYEREWIE